MTLLLCAGAAAGAGAAIGRWWVLWFPPLVALAWAAGVAPATRRADTPAVVAVLVAEVALAAGVRWRRWPPRAAPPAHAGLR